jgi:mannose-6-phosphate isomerase-like protein (cupin superfamily)
MPMPNIKDVSIINWNKTEAKPVASGLERTICSKSVCGSKYLDVHHRTVSRGRKFEVQAGNDYHLVYVIEAPKGGTISFNGKSHAAEDGAGVLLVPGESASFEASGSDLQMLHMVCVESTVRLLDGSRLTPTNAIQAGEMRYHDGGSSPYHQHLGTPANPDGPSHCYITFKGRGVVQVGDDTQELEPGTLVFFPTGVPHRLRAKGGPLDYFELQAWKSFKTNVLSEEKLGLKWYYDPVKPGAERVEWDQT